MTCTLTGAPHYMRAWRVYVPVWGCEPQAVMVASTRGKALARSYASATGAGYRLKWTDFRVVRAPEFDTMINQHGVFSWAWEHAQRIQSRR